MAYTLPPWANNPSTATPLSAANLTELNNAINDLDLRAASVESRTTAVEGRTTAVESGKVSSSMLTTKGDLFVATAAGVISRFPVGGTDGQILSVDSSQSGGMRWTTAGAGVSSVTAGDSTITMGGTATNPTVVVSAATLNAKAPLASPTFTGTVTTAGLVVTSALVVTPVALTDAATIAVNASLGNHFRVTLAGNRTMGAPSSPTDGQKMLFEIIQDGTGSRTMAWTGGTGGYAFGTDVTSPTLTTTINKRDFVGFVYNSTANLWFCLAVAKGY